MKAYLFSIPMYRTMSIAPLTDTVIVIDRLGLRWALVLAVDHAEELAPIVQFQPEEAILPHAGPCN